MKLYLIRHGETYLNKYQKMQGWADSPLTLKGFEMARQCGEYLKDYPITHMITSDLGRTIATGREIADVIGLTGTIRQMTEFRETFFGSFEGSDSAEVWAKVARHAGFQNVMVLYHTSSISEIMDYFHQADPTGDAENYQTFINRLEEGLSRIETEYDEEAHIVLVTHGNTIRNISYLIDSTINLAEHLDNAGVTIIDMTTTGRKVLLYNQTTTRQKEEQQ